VAQAAISASLGLQGDSQTRNSQVFEPMIQRNARFRKGWICEMGNSDLVLLNSHLEFAHFSNEY